MQSGVEPFEKEADLNLNLALAYEKKEKLDQALSKISIAIEMMRFFKLRALSVTLHHRARIYQKLDKVEESKKDSNEAAKIVMLTEIKLLQGESFRILDEIGEFEGKGKQAENIEGEIENACVLVYEAYQRYNGGQYKAALLLANQACENHPIPFASVIISKSLIKLKDFEGALREIDFMISQKIYPNRAEVHYLKAIASAHLGAHKIAQEHLLRGMEYHSRAQFVSEPYVEDYIDAFAAWQLCEAPDANLEEKQGDKTPGSICRNYYNKGLTYLTAGKTQEGIDQLTVAIWLILTNLDSVPDEEFAQIVAARRDALLKAGEVLNAMLDHNRLMKVVSQSEELKKKTYEKPGTLEGVTISIPCTMHLALVYQDGLIINLIQSAAEKDIKKRIIYYAHANQVLKAGESISNNSFVHFQFSQISESLIEEYSERKLYAFLDGSVANLIKHLQNKEKFHHLIANLKAANDHPKLTDGDSKEASKKSKGKKKPKPNLIQAAPIPEDTGLTKELKAAKAEERKAFAKQRALEKAERDEINALCNIMIHDEVKIENKPKIPQEIASPAKSEKLKKKKQSRAERIKKANDAEKEKLVKKNEKQLKEREAKIEAEKEAKESLQKLAKEREAARKLHIEKVRSEAAERKKELIQSASQIYHNSVWSAGVPFLTGKVKAPLQVTVAEEAPQPPIVMINKDELEKASVISEVPEQPTLKSAETLDVLSTAVSTAEIKSAQDVPTPAPEPAAIPPRMNCILKGEELKLEPAEINYLLLIKEQQRLNRNIPYSESMTFVFGDIPRQRFARLYVPTGLSLMTDATEAEIIAAFKSIEVKSITSENVEYGQVYTITMPTGQQITVVRGAALTGVQGTQDERLLAQAKMMRFSIDNIFVDEAHSIYVPIVETVEDILTNKLNTQVSPWELFAKHPASLLQALYYANKLNITLPPNIENACITCSALMTNAIYSYPEMHKWLIRLFDNPRALSNFTQLHRLGVLDALFPTLAASIVLDQEWLQKEIGQEGIDQNLLYMNLLVSVASQNVIYGQSIPGLILFYLNLNPLLKLNFDGYIQRFGNDMYQKLMQECMTKWQLYHRPQAFQQVPPVQNVPMNFWALPNVNLPAAPYSNSQPMPFVQSKVNYN